MNIIQVFNSMSMVFPLMTWMKKRKKHNMSKTLLHKIIAIHIPISFVYHAFGAFNKNARVLQFVDFALIHLTSLLTSKSVCHKLKTPWLPLVFVAPTIPLHAIACLDVFKGADNIGLRFGTIVFNNSPVLVMSRPLGGKTLVVGAVCYKLYTHKYGHPIFHVVLMELYECCYEMCV